MSKKMQDKQSTTIKEVCSNVILDMFSVVAIKIADSLCSCFMYEPKVSKKLRKTQ